MDQCKHIQLCYNFNEEFNLFSQLNPKEEKILKYVKIYMDYIDPVDKFFELNKNIQKIDNKIQQMEIVEHLLRKNINPDEESEVKQQEVITWANLYSKNFRAYLNSIKLVTLLLYAWGINKSDQITEVKLLEAIKIINQYDGILLNQIYLDQIKNDEKKYKISL